MAQELPAAADRTRLGLILSRWRDWDAALAAAPLVERKLGGLSNDNYLVSSAGRKFVVRLNNDNFDLDVDRQVERRILAEIAARPFSPGVVFSTDACLVTAFVDGTHPAAPDPAVTGDLMRQIHAIDSRAATPLDPYLHLERYLRRVTRPPTVLEACFEAVMSARLPPAGSSCLCHHDLLAENVIVTPSGPVAIDWEYARPGDAAFDMAVVAHTYAYDETMMARLLAVYGGDAGMAARVEHYRDVYALVEICWWLIRGWDVDSMNLAIQNLGERLGIS